MTSTGSPRSSAIRAKRFSRSVIVSSSHASAYLTSQNQNLLQFMLAKSKKGGEISLAHPNVIRFGLPFSYRKGRLSSHYDTPYSMHPIPMGWCIPKSIPMTNTLLPENSIPGPYRTSAPGLLCTAIFSGFGLLYFDVSERQPRCNG